jgi:curved DNA-binding protein CbpA
MNHYEELGLASTASPEEIHRAHRVLSRLLHPDQQTDPALRQAAEVQMRRVNAMIDILLDPARRRLYDDSLRLPPPALVLQRVLRKRPVRRSRSTVRLIAVIAFAMVITLVVIWLAGDFFPWHGIG